VSAPAAPVSAAPRSSTAEHSRPGELSITFDGVTRHYACAVEPNGTLWLARDGQAWGIREQAPLEQQLADDPAGGGPVRSPMPGTVTVVEVADGQRVAAGDRLVIVEAMKMEHVLTAPVDGVVRGLRATAGATVARDAVLLTVEPSEED
jgi:3-methylcrotonyl-CoA carboxylase alpha subunit